MPYEVKITNNVNVPKHLEQVDNDKFWTFAANEWWKLITPFTPFDTGTMSESVKITPKTVTYFAPYAARNYKGEGLHFRKDKHHLATAKWDIAAIPTQQTKLITTLQDYVNNLL